MSVALVALLLPIIAYGNINNGDFEGGSYADGGDTVPNNWSKYETFSGGLFPESSFISLVDDNGLSAPGDKAARFVRVDFGNESGDWTAIQQGVSISTADYSTLELRLDVKVVSHDLCGGGWTGAWEYPITVEIGYEDSDGDAKIAQTGWHLFTKPWCQAQNNWWWWSSSNRWAKANQVSANTWYAESIDLLDPTLDIVHITRIRIGGTGWNYEGRADNVSIVGETASVTIEIDIKPGNNPNAINLKSKGVIPVAILTTGDFDATDVDGSTVEFEGASPVHDGGHLEDVDSDGDLDWVGHFRIQATDIEAGDTEATLVGEAVIGGNRIPIEDSDSIKVVGVKAAPSLNAKYKLTMTWAAIKSR